jgi:hypothetical protein
VGLAFCGNSKNVNRFILSAVCGGQRVETEFINSRRNTLAPLGDELQRSRSSVKAVSSFVILSLVHRAGFWFHRSQPEFHLTQLSLRFKPFAKYVAHHEIRSAGGVVDARRARVTLFSGNAGSTWR